MELEDRKLDECIDDIIAILEDEKELKARSDAQQAVFKLRQLKQESFIITTHNEIEVCRDALASVINKTGELNQTIRDAKDDIDKKQKEATDALEDATKYISEKQTEITNAIQGAKDDIHKKQTEAVEDVKADIGEKQKETIEAITDITQKALQDALQKLDEQSLCKRVRRLELDNCTSKQRLTLLESKVDTLDNVRRNHEKQLDYVERKQVLQKGLVTMYQNDYVRTSFSPLKTQDNSLKVTEVYVTPEMVVNDIDKNESLREEKPPDEQNTRNIQQYREILQTNDQKHKRIYIVGDVWTGKSTFCKMMIQNWCSAITADGSRTNKPETPRKSCFKCRNDDQRLAENDENINEMRNFDFLFFVPLQRMSGYGDITEMIKAIVTAADLASTGLIDRIFEQESERCLIVADGLDEWIPPKVSVLQHVSYGLPNRSKAKHAILVTLSRPSAKGLLNIKSSEYDQKVELLGINKNSITDFIKTYLSKFPKTDLSYEAFMEKTRTAKPKHLEKTPLLLQQLVWLYCTGNDIGKSVSDTYCHIVNIMLGWSQKRDEGEDMDGDQIDVTKQDEHMQLPRLLQKFPRCEANKRFLLPLAKVAYDALTSEIGSSTFGRLDLQQRGIPKDVITALIRFGILIENNCFDRTKENTQLEFIHISYLGFFAAVYVSSNYKENQRSKLPKTNLQDLFQKCKSAADVLQLSNVLKLISGLSPFLLSELSKSVSDIVNVDESVIRFRNYPSTYGRYRSVLREIQCLILDCLSECDTDGQQMVNLCDVIIYYRPDESFLQRIIPDNVVSLYVFSISDVEVCRWIARLKRLQYLYIGPSLLSHNGMVLVSSLIQEAPLKYLSLYSVRCKLCYDHEINLSNNDQLQKLDIVNGTRVTIHNINTKHLEVARFGAFKISDIALLLHARNLTELYIENTSRPYYIYDEQVNFVVQTLQQLRKLKLERVYISDSAFIVTPGMRNFQYIELLHAAMIPQTWCRFVDSLLTLQQSVQVDISDYMTLGILTRDKLNYVSRNTTMFEVINFLEMNTKMYKMIGEDCITFKFRTKK